MLAYYVIVQFTKVVSGLRVYPERMLRNLDASFGLVFSQPVLLALVEAGASRDDAYRIVQRNAMRAWQEERSFRELLVADPDVRAVLDDARLDACFDLKRALANVGRTFDELDRIEATHCPATMGVASMASTTGLPHLYSGKVRELYEVGHDRLLMVASDRVSVFDVVLPDEIPDKGRVLTGVSQFWFDETADIVANHVISSDPTDFPETAGDVGGRAMLVRATRPIRSGVRRTRLPLRARLDGVPASRAPSAGSGCRPGCSRPSGCPSRCSPRRRRPRPATTCRSPQARPPSSSAHDRLRATARPLDPALRAAARRARTRAGSCSPTRSSSSASSTARSSRSTR